jgi:hypothetical protein
MAVVATVKVRKNSFRDMYISSVFKEARSVKDIVSWAKSVTGNEDISICDILLSEWTERNNNKPASL